MNIGAILKGMIQVEAQISPTNPDQAVIFLDNTGKVPVSFTQLVAFEHADPSLFTTNGYISGMEQTGQSVQIGPGPQGILLSGETPVATVNTSGDIVGFSLGRPPLNSLAAIEPLTPAPFYDGGIIRVDGQLYAFAVSSEQVVAAPEPRSLTNVFSGLLTLAGAALCFRWYRRRAAAVA
jgi:hypothetical protein